MAQMERIIRPHLPVNIYPTKTTAKCREAPENKVAKFAAPSGMSVEQAKPKEGEQDKQPKKPQEKTRNSSWSYGYKLYMTKKEKETDKCEEDRVVGGARATDVPQKQSPEPSE